MSTKLKDELDAFLKHAIRIVMMTPPCRCWEGEEHRGGGHIDECQWALSCDVMSAAGTLVQLKPEAQTNSASWALNRLSGVARPSWSREQKHED